MMIINSTFIYPLSLYISWNRNETAGEIKIMDIEVQSLNFTLTPSQCRYVEQQIGFALASNVDNIKRVQVWLSENSIAEGNVVKRCQVQVELEGEVMVVIESTDLNLRVALNRAADRASRKLSRISRRKILAFQQPWRSGLWSDSRPQTQYMQNAS